jgi:hypothetical protein
VCSACAAISGVGDLHVGVLDGGAPLDGGEADGARDAGADSDARTDAGDGEAGGDAGACAALDATCGTCCSGLACDNVGKMCVHCITGGLACDKTNDLCCAPATCVGNNVCR